MKLPGDKEFLIKSRKTILEILPSLIKEEMGDEYSGIIEEILEDEFECDLGEANGLPRKPFSKYAKLFNQSLNEVINDVIKLQNK